MANSYITLTSDETPTPSLGGRFHVIIADPGYTRFYRKSQSVEETIGGGLDIGEGGVYLLIRYMLRVLHTEPDSNYGNLADIIAMYALNNPNGTPSSTLKLTTHEGVNYNVKLLGDMNLKPLTFAIEGSYAWFLIPIALQVLP